MSEDITFPKKWKELSKEEQKEWIRAYYMPKARIPEPIVLKSGKIKEGMLKLENGAKIRFPVKTLIASKSNPNVVREFEFWVGKWLVTVFNDKTIPCLSTRAFLYLVSNCSYLRFSQYTLHSDTRPPRILAVQMFGPSSGL